MSECGQERLDSITNDELLERLQALVRKSHCADAALLVHIGEVDARRLYLDQAFPSMFEFCTRGLHMEEGVAYNRIYAARAARQHPALIDALRAGELHLTAIRLIAPLLTQENCADWIGAAKHRSVREIRARLADHQPKPDVEASVRKERVPPASPTSSVEVQPHMEPCGSPRPAAPLPPPPSSPVSRASRSEPLGAGRYCVKFMADEECYAALGELRSLLRHEISDGDWGKILKRAVSELLVKTRQRKFAELAGGRASKGLKREASRDGTSREEPASQMHRPASRHIPHAIRRAVWKRDEGRCRFVSSDGRRCGSRDFLEFDHLEAWALHRRHSVEGISLLCRAHNQAAARALFGEGHMERCTRPSAQGRTSAERP